MQKYRLGKGLSLTMLLMSVCQCVFSQPLPLSEADIQELVDAHNFFRGMVDPPASNMQRVQWNEELARVAQAYAEMCQFRDNPNRADNVSFPTVGESLSASNTRSPNYTEFVERSWFNQRVNYNYQTNMCSSPGSCTDYVQLVWADSTELGCGAARCPIIDGFPLPNSILLVCNYAPEGRLEDGRPYMSGNFCSECLERFLCVDNLCTLPPTTSPPPTTMVTASTATSTTTEPTSSTTTNEGTIPPAVTITDGGTTPPATTTGTLPPATASTMPPTTATTVEGATPSSTTVTTNEGIAVQTTEQLVTTTTSVGMETTAPTQPVTTIQTSTTPSMVSTTSSPPPSPSTIPTTETPSSTPSTTPSEPATTVLATTRKPPPPTKPPRPASNNRFYVSTWTVPIGKTNYQYKLLAIRRTIGSTTGTRSSLEDDCTTTKTKKTGRSKSNTKKGPKSKTRRRSKTNTRRRSKTNTKRRSKSTRTKWTKSRSKTRRRSKSRSRKSRTGKTRTCP